MLDTIKSALSGSEMNDIYRLAREELREEETLDAVADDLIVRRYFSEDKKRKYLVGNRGQ